MSTPLVAIYSSEKGILRLTAEDARKLDILYVSFGVLKNGQATVDHLQCLSRLPEIRAMNPSLKVVLAVGGGAERGWDEAVRSPKALKILIDSILAIVKAHGFDGVDVDWEYPKHDFSQKKEHTALLKGLREGLDAIRPGLLLSLASCTTDWYFDLTELSESVKYLDHVNLMTYDVGFSTPYTVHHCCSRAMPAGIVTDGSAEENIRLFIEKGVPAEKLLIGGAFYSRMWSGVKDENHGLYAPAEVTSDYGPNYDELSLRYIDKNGYVRYWDDQAKAPWLYNGDVFITYDDPQSLAEKCALVHQYHLRGIMAWEYSSDSTHTLLDAMASGIRDKKEASIRKARIS